MALSSVSFKIPSIPPSVNSLYNVIFSLKKVELKPDCLSWKSKAKTFMPPFKSSGESVSGMLKVDMKFSYPLYHKNLKVRRIDTPNMMKLLLDAISERYGIDDKFMKFGSFVWSTTDSDAEAVEVTVNEMA